MRVISKALSGFLMIVSLGLGSNCGPGELAPADGAPPHEIEAEVKAHLDRYVSALESRDSQRVRSLYVDDGRLVWLEDGTPRYFSPDEIVEALGAFPPGMAIKTELSGLRVTVLSDGLAWAYARFDTHLSGESMDVRFDGVLSMVVERTSEGAWRVVAGHSSSTRSRPDAFESDQG